MMHKDFFIRNIPQGRLCAAVRLLIISKKSSEEQTMHMADALLSPAVAVTMYAASAAAAGVSLVQLRREELAAPETAKKKLPTMAVMSALVFAGQMINYTIPGTGSSGHLCGGMLLSAMLGPWAGFLSMIVILAIQALFFADGGLLALGANVWNMAFYGCFVGYFLIYRPLMRGNLSAGKARLRLTLASVLGCVATLQLGAFSVVLETTLSGITAYPAEVSGGELQRFSIARALGQRTEILLADEISAMLDLITQRQIWSALLKETQSRGISLVAVSHSQELLEKICSRILHLSAISG